MKRTFSVRIDDELLRTLEERAAELGISISSFIREIPADAVAEPLLFERVGHLKGSLDLSEPDDSFGRHIKTCNWRPV